MKYHSILAGLIMCATPAAHANDITLADLVPAPKPKLSATLSSEFVTSYFVSSGDKLGDEAVQSSALLTHSSLPGWSLFLWWSIDVNGGTRSGAFTNEFDFVIAKEVSLGNGYTFSTSAALYDEPNGRDLFSYGHEDILVFDAKVSKTFGKLDVFAKAALYVPLNDSEEPWLVSVGGCYHLPYGFTLAPTLAFDTGGFGADSGFIGSVTLGKSVELGRGVSLSVRITQWLPFVGDRREYGTVGAIGLSKSF